MAKLPTLPGRVGTAPARIASTQPGSWRRPGATSTQRGYDYAWQKARAGYLAHHPFCVRCLAEQGIKGQTREDVIVECAERGIPVPWAHVVDHRIPHRGDKDLFWDKANWQSLCTTHHSRDKQREEAGTPR